MSKNNRQKDRFCTEKPQVDFLTISQELGGNPEDDGFSTNEKVLKRNACWPRFIVPGYFHGQMK